MAFLLFVGVAIADDGSNLDLGSQTIDGTQSFEGEVTALGSNAGDPDHTFTAIADDGQAKVFKIASLENLDVGDRVSLQYVETEVYPQSVTSIRFIETSGGK